MKGSNFVDFHSPDMAATGAWRRVVYSEKRKGSVTVTIAALLDGLNESTYFAVDDLTFKSGSCDPAPRDGSCDFDFGDACGYSIGNRTGQWRLSDWTKVGNNGGWLLSKDASTGERGGYVHHTAPKGQRTSAVLTSPKLKGKSEKQCLRFYYYVPLTSGDKSFAYTFKVFISSSAGAPRTIWERSRDSLVNDRWSPVQVSFSVNSHFQLDIECSIGSGPHKDFYCAVDAIRLVHCERQKGNDNQDCDFERGFCTWHNIDETPQNNSQWALGGGTTKTTLARPSKDHTFGKSTGSYVYFSSFQQIRGNAARLVSEPVVFGGLVAQCMEFWYIVAGEKAAKLRVQSIPINGNPLKTLLWEAKGGQFDTWSLGRVALPDKTRVIFEGIAAASAPHGYAALDDITVFANESCETTPKGASLNNEVDDILDCDFGERSLCRWSFPAKQSGVEWWFADAFPTRSNVGPRPLPTGVSGSFIHTNREIMVKNGGSMRLISPVVAPQEEPFCAIFWYNMFGGLGTTLNLTEQTLHPFSGGDGIWVHSNIFYRDGRTNADRWYSVQRTLGLSDRSNQLKFIFTTRQDVLSEVAIGPVQVTRGACRAVTSSQGWCDFEHDMCGWTPDEPRKGWKRVAESWNRKAANSRSGPVDAYFLLELRSGAGSNDSTISSPWLEGKPQPRCLQFWYRRDTLVTGNIMAEINTGSEKQRNVVWREPPYPMKDWMLARIPVLQEKRFQVVFRGNVTNSQNTESSLGLDDVEVSPEPCKPLFECGFEDDLCGYVNDYTETLRWLVGTGRLLKQGLSPALPTPPRSFPTLSDGAVDSWTRFAYVDLTVPSWSTSGSGKQESENLTARLISPVFDVLDYGEILKLTYFRRGPDIVSMELSQVAYQDDSGTATDLQAVQLGQAEVWLSTNFTLKPSNQSQLVISLQRGLGTNGTAAISVICSAGPASPPDDESSLACDFEKGTFCGWDPSVGAVPFKLNDPANNVPAFPRSDHTLRAYKGRFIYVESKGKNDSSAGLRSPEIPENDRASFCFSLWHLALPNTAAFIIINDTVNKYTVLRDDSRYSHHWAHAIFQMKMPANGTRLAVNTLVSKGLVAIDDLEITPGFCAQRDKCTFEWASPCSVNSLSGALRPWKIAPSRLLNISDHTLGSNEGNYLFVNTTNVSPSEPETMMFFGDRKPTPATCLTFWWKGFGTPSNLNVYIHTKETILRDPILSLYTRPTPRWWNVRQVTISSKSSWKLVFETVSAVSSSVQSGVMIDDVEFADGGCPPENLCTFEEDICVPWEQVVASNSSGMNKGWEVQRAEQFERLKKDHTLSSDEGYYLLFRSTGNILDSVSLELREPRFQCGSFWYFISESANGSHIEVDNMVLAAPTKSWKRARFALKRAGRQSIIATSGTDKNAFLAVDDILADERRCENIGK
ncbi:unnamed protein product [Ixodes hexagonus]